MNGPYWFEVAVVCALTAVGGIVFAPFAELEPKWRRLAKLAAGVAIGVGISAWAGRGWFFALLGVVAALVLLVHGWWLPRRHGINGWTAEPREKYLALRGGKRGL